VVPYYTSLLPLKCLYITVKVIWSRDLFIFPQQVDSKATLGVGGIVIVLMAVGSALGIFGYAGVTTTLLTIEVSGAYTKMDAKIVRSGDLQGCEMLRITQLDNLLTDGGTVISPMHRPRSTPQKLFSASVTHFC
jgi:hypothetical protein